MGIYYKDSYALLNGEGVDNGYNRGILPTPHPLPPISAEIVAQIEREFLPYIFVDQRDKGYTRVKYHCVRCANAKPGSHYDYVWTDRRTVTPEIRTLYQAKHNTVARCPVCGSSGTVKERRYLQRPDNYSEWRYYLIFQQASPNEVFIRILTCCRRREVELTEPTSFSECGYYRLTPRRCEYFDYGYGGWHSYTNENVRKGGYPGFKIFGVDDLKGSFLQYSVTAKFVNDFRSNIALASCFAALYPCTEMLYKAGFSGVITDWITQKKKNAYCLNIEAERVTELFKLPKTTLDYLMREVRSDIKVSRNISYVFRGIKLFGKDIEGCRLAIEYCDRFSFWYSQADIRRAYSLLYGAKKYDRGRLLELVRYIERYKEKQQGKGYIDFNGALRFYCDYLHEGDFLKLDFNEHVVRFPKDLKAAHDTTAKLAALVREKEAQKKLDTLYEKYTEQYGFEKYGYKVIAPKSTKEIIAEGKAMHHCVGGYADRHAEGKLAILFIRKVTDIATPYVTVEVNGSTVKQVQGMSNKPTWEKEADHGESFNQFLSEWKSFIKKNKKPLCAVV